MLEQMLALDHQLFYLINSGSANALFDVVMPWWRDKTTWIPLYLLIAGASLYYFRWRGLYFILAVALTVGVADTVSSKIMKPTFERVRPCNDTALEVPVIQRGGCGGGYSFTSSHATNHLAIAVFMALTLGAVFKWVRIPLIFWALSIAYGQVYVGVHFPGDVITGGAIGTGIGIILGYIYQRQPMLQLKKREDGMV